jgi:choline dehydrogenase-like flavoprotein
MTTFSPQQRQTLHALVDTLAPALPAPPGADPAFYESGGVTLGIPALLEESLLRVTDEAALNDLRQFLRLLEVPAVNWLMARQWGAFSKLELEARTAILAAWGNSKVGLARQAFQGVKRLTLFLFYAHQPAEKPNPTWATLHYPGASGPQTQEPHRFTTLPIQSATTLHTEVLVIGSGAGGGVVAAELSAAGHQVLIVEKGGHYEARDFVGDEVRGNEMLYENYGALTTADLSMSILAGSTLGGGTTVNWAASLRPPEDVLQEWERDFGFTGATSAAFHASIEAVCQRMNVSTAESHANPQNAALERGCQALGYRVSVIPRNVQGCEECGACGYGCPFAAKQGTLQTFLADAQANGAQIMVRAYVEYLTHQAGAVTGAVLTVQDEQGQPHSLTVHAKAVVVAAGSLHTPALLKRSGLGNPNIGANLRLHPVSTATGQYDQPIRSWQGPPMTRLFNDFANLDGRGYGYRIETPPAHPGILGAAFPWQSGQQHRHLMAAIEYDAHFIILVRDYYSGRVKVNKHGRPVVQYQVHPYDAKHLLHGLKEAMKLHRAAGAQVIFSPHNRFMQHRVNGNASFESFWAQVEGLGLQPNAYALFSAHQMGSCRIAGDPERGALQPTGESYDLKRLFVADASVFPTASGVNPMITIMGTCHYLAQHIKVLL